MTEIPKYDLTIKAGSDYKVDFSYTDDDENPEDVSFWTVESHFRPEVESSQYIQFTGYGDENGYHLQLSKNQTRKLRFAHGVYDVFVTDPDGVRTPLIQGEVNIIPEVTR